MKMKEKKELGKISPTEVQKRCSICHTTTTPLWRVGPAGPKSLCNACGIKYTKRRRNLLGLNRGKTEKGKNRKNRAHGGDDVAKPTPALKKLKLIAEMRSKKLGEEERAAILLMALSCGSFYA